MLLLTTPEKADVFCKITPDDLRLTQEEYDVFLVDLIKYASATILNYINRKNLTQTELDDDEFFKMLLESSCLRLIQNYLLVNLQAKNSPIINIDDFNISFPDKKVFTDDIKSDLRGYRIIKVKAVGSTDE